MIIGIRLDLHEREDKPSTIRSFVRSQVKHSFQPFVLWYSNYSHSLRHEGITSVGSSLLDRNISAESSTVGDYMAEDGSMLITSLATLPDRLLVLAASTAASMNMSS